LIHIYENLKHACFSPPGFIYFGNQRETVVGSYSSLVASLAIVLLVLFLISGNLFIALYALIMMAFAISKLGIVEAITIIMSVGLSVDFRVGYIHTDSNNGDRKRQKFKDRYLPSTSESNENENHYRKVF